MEEFLKIFPRLPDSEIAGRLRRIPGIADVVLDTDTFNSIDDQYALAYLVNSTEAVRVRAIYAAPFWSDPAWNRPVSSDSPADGMQKSYDEILKVLSLMGKPELASLVYRGSDRYLPDALTPVDSPAARHLVSLSREYTSDHPLYIVELACPTTVSSALLMDPTLRERVVVVWLGGHGHHFGTCDDFNCRQDLASSRILFTSGVPLVQLPLLGVISHFSFCKPELEQLFRNRNALCDYLIDSTFAFAKKKFDYEYWTKPLWDICVSAWAVNPGFFESRIVTAPTPQADNTYSFPAGNPPLCYVYYVHKDPLVRDLVFKLSR